MISKELDPVINAEEFTSAVYPKGAKPEQVNEARLSFVAGWHRCMSVMQKIVQMLPEEEAIQAISDMERSCMEFGKAYEIKQRLGVQ